MQSATRLLVRSRPSALLPASTSVLPTHLPLPPRRGAKGGKKGRDDKGKRRAQDDARQNPGLPELESEYNVHLDRPSAHRAHFMTLSGDRDFREGEQLDLETMKANLDKAVQQLRVDLKPVMGLINTALPTSVVENIKLLHEGVQTDLTALASVSMIKGGGLKMVVYNEKNLLPVEQALLKHNLSPSRGGADISLTIKPVAMTTEARQNLFRRADDICREASVRIKRAREVAHKALRADTKNKIVNAQESRREQTELDDEVRRRSTEVGKIRDECRKQIMDH